MVGFFIRWPLGYALLASALLFNPVAVAGGTRSRTVSPMQYTNTSSPAHFNDTSHSGVKSSSSLSEAGTMTATAEYILAGIAGLSTSSKTKSAISSAPSTYHSRVTGSIIKPPFSDSHRQWSNGTISATGRPDRNLTGDGLASALKEASACQSRYVAWSEAHYTPSICVNQTERGTTIYPATLGTADIYTTSEGIAVAHGSFTSTGSTTVTSFYWANEGSNCSEIMTSPELSCSFDPAACTIMYKDWMAGQGLTLFKDAIPVQTVTLDTKSPRCGMPIAPLNAAGAGTSTNFASCSFWAGNVKVFYWPPETAGALRTAHTSNDRAVTAHWRNLTFTSPSIYASFDFITAWSEGVLYEVSATTDIIQSEIDTQIGLAPKNVIISMRPEDVSTYQLSVSDWSEAASLIRKDLVGSFFSVRGSVMTPHPFDPAHISAPSLEQYYLGPAVINHVTEGGDKIFNTMYDAQYRPLLAIPSQLQAMNKHWSNCQPALQGVYDPPSALRTAPEAPLTSLSPPAGDPTQAPQPSSVPEAPTPYVTSTSIALPTTRSAGSLTPSSNLSPSTSPVPVALPDRTTVEFSSITVSDVVDTDSPDDIHPAATPSSQTSPGSVTVQTVTFANGVGTTIEQAAPSAGSASQPQPSVQLTTNALSILSDAESLQSSANTHESSSQAFSHTAGVHLSFESQNQPAVLSSGASHQGADAVTPTSQGNLVPGQGKTYTPSVLVAFTHGSQAQATTVDGQVVSAIQGGVLVNSVFVTQGSSAETIGGAAHSVDASGRVWSLPVTTGVIDSQTATGVAQGVPSPSPTSPMGQAIVTVNDLSLTANGDSSAAIIGGSTISVGGPALTTSDLRVSLGSQGLVVEGTGIGSLPSTSMQTLSADQDQIAAFEVASGIMTATKPGGESYAYVQGDTVSVGGPAITLSGNTVSLGTAGIVVLGNDQTKTAVFDPIYPPTSATLVIGTETITAVKPSGPNYAVLQGQTLTMSGAAMVLNSETVSLGIDGIIIASGGQSKTAPFGSSFSALSATLTDGMMTLSAVESFSPSTAVVDGLTLRLGGPAAITAGATLSLGSSGVVVYSPNGTTTLSFTTQRTSAVTSEPSATSPPEAIPHPSPTSTSPRSSATASGSSRYSYSYVLVTFMVVLGMVITNIP